VLRLEHYFYADYLEPIMKNLKSVMGVILLGAPLLASAASPDEAFLKKAAQGGMAEVQAGELAQTKGSSQAVKDFGAMMVKDHSAANAKLKALAASKDVKLPDGADLKHKAMKKKLQMKSGASFDKEYIEGQIKDHKDTVDLLQKETASGQDGDAKAFASEVLPTVQGHLQKIEQIAANAGVSDK